MKQNKKRNVYYYVLEGSRLLFADERDKKKLLDLLTESFHLQEWNVYAFCVTNDRVCLLTEATGEEDLVHTCEKAGEAFLHLPRNWLAGPESVPKKIRSGLCSRIDTQEKLDACMKQIHQMPLNEGYVSDPADYWWSSYITYQGIYCWSLVSHRHKICAPGFVFKNTQKKFKKNVKTIHSAHCI